MAKLIMVAIGKIGGVTAYGPLDIEDEKAINGQNTIICDVKSNKSKRTSLQNRSIYKYFELLGEGLNNSGWDMKRTLTKQADIPWLPLTVKEFLWKPIQAAMLGTESTTKLETEDVSKVYETLNRHTATKLGVSVPFPDKYYKMYEQDLKDAKERA